MTPRAKPKVVCECLGVTEAEVVAAIDGEGLSTVKQVAACTDAGSGCTACHPAIREYLARRARSESRAETRAASSPQAYL